LEHQAAGGVGGALRCEGREAGGNEVGVDEFVHLQLLAEEAPRVGGLARTVRACDDEEIRHATVLKIARKSVSRKCRPAPKSHRFQAVNSAAGVAPGRAASQT
jgi:hypothetical protein